MAHQRILGVEQVRHKRSMMEAPQCSVHETQLCRGLVAHQRILGVEQVHGQRLGQLRLADAGGPQEHERRDGALRVAQPRARPARQDIVDILATTMRLIAQV